MDKLNRFAGLFIDPAEINRDTADFCHQVLQQYQFSLLNLPPQSGLFLHANHNGIGLRDSSFAKQAAVMAEFTSAEMRYRLQRSGAKSELIMRAIGNKQAPWQVIDATPGLGRDAMVMAHFGCHVTMLERSPVVATLLADGLRKLALVDFDLSQKLTLHFGDSITLLNSAVLGKMGLQQPDVVYLDPMFPHKKKSALVKKEMQVFQRLLGDDADAGTLLTSALSVAKRRVVVKRPNYAAPLNEQAPNLTVTSKKHRFDVYLTH